MHPLVRFKNLDLAVSSGSARQCPDQRSKPGAIQAFYSRAGAKEGTPWASQTPSNYSYHFYPLPLKLPLFHLAWRWGLGAAPGHQKGVFWAKL